MYKRIDNYIIVFNNKRYGGGIMVGFFLSGRTYGIVKEHYNFGYDTLILEKLHLGGKYGIKRQFIVVGDYPKRVEGILIEYA